MAPLINKQGNSIMSSRAAGALLETLHKRLATRMAEMDSREHLLLLHKFHEELRKEENIDLWIADEAAAIRTRISSVHFVDELKPLCATLQELAIRHFEARSSVSTLHELSTGFLEAILSASVSLATELLKLEGSYPADYSSTMLLSGAIGRRESTQRGHNTVIFVYENGTVAQRAYFHQLTVRIMAILNECGIPVIPGLQIKNNCLWCGSMDEWLELLDISSTNPEKQPGESWKELSSEESFPVIMETVADLRPLSGDSNLAAKVIESGKKFLARNVVEKQFRSLARNISTLPVGLGIFGRLRTVKTGKHRGEFSLEEMATRPLVACIRLLAVTSGIAETSTVERIKALLAAGELGVTQADRLLIAFHNFTRCKLELEMDGEMAEEYFFKPGNLREDARECLKSGLEDLTTLQRLVYQQIVEVGQ